MKSLKQRTPNNTNSTKFHHNF